MKTAVEAIRVIEEVKKQFVCPHCGENLSMGRYWFHMKCPGLEKIKQKESENGKTESKDTE